MKDDNDLKISGKNIVVLGVHRSGTSLVSSFIEEMGVWFGYNDEALVKRKDNPKGFWERTDVVNLNDKILSSLDLQWHSLIEEIPTTKINQLRDKFANQIKLVLSRLDDHGVWFIKDPRLVLTWPVWEGFIDEPMFIVVYRDPISVSQSLCKRNAMPINYGLALWLYQTKSLAKILQKSESKIILTQEELIDNPAIIADKIYEKISSLSNELKPVRENLIETMFDASLVHHHVNTSELQKIAPLISQCWNLLEQNDFEQIAKLNLSPDKLITEELTQAWKELYRRELLLREFDFEIQNKNNEIQNKNNEIQNKNNEIIDKSNQVSELENGIKNIFSCLDEYKTSTSYKISSIPRLIKDKVKRKKSLTALDEIEKTIESLGWNLNAQKKHSSLPFRIIKIVSNNPKQILSNISLKRLKSLYSLVKDPNARINIDHALARYEKVKYDRSLVLFKPGGIDENEIKLQCDSNPKVSIVIPVYNEYQTTLACLNSIAELTTKVSYEVIIANDNSTDATTEIESRVQNLRVFNSDKNQGFLHNCNSAIRHARGEYILLLNNDTNVQADWLSELTDLLESDATIGIVGSKLIYPDGRLQEAGGIIFNDGSGWNYGRLDDPQKPEYCFVRDVDYISGACILIRKNLWNHLDGFDKRFAPAYYEDTDLCLSVRKKGYRVVFTPFSKVVHYEGVSHGTDETLGVKKHQRINQEKFREKWADTLNLEHEKNEEKLFIARHNGKVKGIVLVIDHYVPMHDKDAGSRSTRKYLELLIENGIKVIFLGDNFYPHQPYTEQLQRLGVEVLYGDYYQNNFSDWLSYNSQFLDCIYIHRPHIAEKYSGLLSSLEPKPRIVYFGHDLHYLRFLREYRLSGDKALLQQSEMWKEKELKIIENMDLSLYPAQYEVDSVKELNSNLTVDTIPLMWFSEDEIYKSNNEQKAVERIIFVGGFGHPPNINGLNWFLDKIWPEVIKHNDQVKLIIIGSKCPKQVFGLACSRIEVLGEVDDKTLAEEYKKARIAIVPLRYGAGIKGKVLEAMAWGVPVCTTSIGAEGLPYSKTEYLLVADEPKEYQANLLALLSNNTLYGNLINESYAIIRSNFSKRSAKKLISHLIVK